MLANLKTVLVYCVTWYVLCLPGNFLVSMGTQHGGSAGRVLMHMINHYVAPPSGFLWTMGDILFTLFRYLLIIGIAFRTLNLEAIKRAGDPLARVLFVSSEVGLVIYAICLPSSWHRHGPWSLVVQMPSLLATVGAAYALRFVWPRPAQTSQIPTPPEGVWPPPPQIT